MKIFEKILQIGIVCENAMETAKKFNDDYGIGPWHFCRFDETTTSGLQVNGKDCPYKIIIGICTTMNVSLELIEPLDDKSIYYEFLKKHGPGMQHIACSTTDGCDESVQKLVDLGNKVVTQGHDETGRKFVYVDCLDNIGLTIEMYKPKTDAHPKPFAYYPPRD
jgi:hypothetical protein